MSDKRFDFNLGFCKIYDKEEERLLEDTEVCGLLNEQQNTIEQLERICQTINSLYNKINQLKEENEQLRKEI